MGTNQYTFNDKYEEYMQNFLCRLLRHDFVVSYINDFFNQNERTYYSFFMLMKVLGAHTNLKFQTNYWSDCYIYFYEKLGIHGILFIPLLLSKGSTEDKKKIIKRYLNEHINNTKERITINSNLVINLLEFKKVILTYISCVSTRGLENVIKAIDNDPEECKFLENEEVKQEIILYRQLYSNQLVESFVDVLLRPYSRQNYYVNAGRFIDDNIDFLTDDKNIRLRLREFSKKQKEISDLFKKTNSFLKKNDPFDINNKLEQINNNKNIEGANKDAGEINEVSDIGGVGFDNNNNNNKTNNINTNQIYNSKIVEQGDMSKSKNIIDNKKGMLHNDSSNIMYNEPSNNKDNKFGKENKNTNEIKLGNKNPDKNNMANMSFKMDFEVKEENIVRPLGMKANNNNPTPNPNININNNINNKMINRDSFSDFDESLKEENIPQNID